MKRELLAWNETVEASFAGRDYPEGQVSPADPEPQPWYDTHAYQPYLPAWQDRWEYKSYLERQRKAKQGPRAKPRVRMRLSGEDLLKYSTAIRLADDLTLIEIRIQGTAWTTHALSRPAGNPQPRGRPA